MPQIPFDWFEFAFECIESRSNGSKLLSNGSNPVRMVRICIPFERLEFAFECFKSHSSGLNLHLNPSNPVRMVGIGIQMP